MCQVYWCRVCARVRVYACAVFRSLYNCQLVHRCAHSPNPAIAIASRNVRRGEMSQRQAVRACVHPTQLDWHAHPAANRPSYQSYDSCVRKNALFLVVADRAGCVRAKRGHTRHPLPCLASYTFRTFSLSLSVARCACASAHMHTQHDAHVSTCITYSTLLRNRCECKKSASAFV